MLPASASVSFYAGDSQSLTGQLLDASGKPIDISADTDYIVLTVRRTPTAPKLIERRAEKVFPAMGNFSVPLSAAELLDVAGDKPVVLVFDLHAVTSGRHRTFISGTMNIVPGVNDVARSS